eukprot:scaffold12104_cov41-Cyclotella_meneghiniana.AAC.1
MMHQVPPYHTRKMGFRMSASSSQQLDCSNRAAGRNDDASGSHLTHQEDSNIDECQQLTAAGLFQCLIVCIMKREKVEIGIHCLQQSPQSDF